MAIFARFLAFPAHFSLCQRKGIQHSRFESGAERREKFQVLGLWESKILNKKLDKNLPKSSTGASILVADVSILVADVSILVAETRFNALLNAILNARFNALLSIG